MPSTELNLLGKVTDRSGLPPRFYTILKQANSQMPQALSAISIRVGDVLMKSLLNNEFSREQIISMSLNNLQFNDMKEQIAKQHALFGVQVELEDSSVDFIWEREQFVFNSMLKAVDMWSSEANITETVALAAVGRLYASASEALAQPISRRAAARHRQNAKKKLINEFTQEVSMKPAYALVRQAVERESQKIEHETSVTVPEHIKNNFAKQ